MPAIDHRHSFAKILRALFGGKAIGLVPHFGSQFAPMCLIGVIQGFSRLRFPNFNPNMTRQRARSNWIASNSKGAFGFARLDCRQADDLFIRWRGVEGNPFRPEPPSSLNVTLPGNGCFWRTTVGSGRGGLT